MNCRNIVIVESPYSDGARSPDSIERNKQYAQLVCRDLIKKGEVPFASHLFFTQFLYDGDREERELGITSGFVVAKHAKEIQFYMDYGASVGMINALQHYIEDPNLCNLVTFKCLFENKQSDPIMGVYNKVWQETLEKIPLIGKVDGETIYFDWVEACQKEMHEKGLNFRMLGAFKHD